MERFSASVAKRLMSCHGSGNLEEAIPHWVPPIEDRSVVNAANRGSLLHEVFAHVMSLTSREVSEMGEAIEYVARFREKRRFNVLVEETVPARWLDQHPNTTADLVLYVQDEMHIFDFKTGKIEVDVTENEQLLFYAATYGPLAPKATGVLLHIVQPSALNMTSWFATTERIDKFMTEAMETEFAIQQGDVELVPGDHCQFCPANPQGRGLKGRPLCPAMMQVLFPKVPMNEEEVLLYED